MLVEITLWSIEVAPAPRESWFGLAGSSPAIITPPPSSYEPLNQIRLLLMLLGPAL